MKPTRRQPNVLLIVTDQQRPDALGAAGNPTLRTPALDRLAREGTRFSRCLTASPVCVASRCAMLTGLAPHVTGVVDNAPMPLDAPMLQHRLAAAGYRTHAVGKMHLTPDPYADWGFASRDTSEEVWHDAGELGRDDYLRDLAAAGYGHVREPHGSRGEFYYVPQPSQLPDRLHHTTWCAARAEAFLKERRDPKQPFLLAIGFIKPHPPFEVPFPWGKLYRPTNVPPPMRRPDERRLWTYWNHAQNRYKHADGGACARLDRLRVAQYYACISHLDRAVGRVLAALGDEADDTLVLFTSDHGELLGDYGCWGKRSMLQPSVGVPMIARLPGRFQAGMRCDTATSLLDVLPTCLAACGADAAQGQLGGVDLAAAARGEVPRDRAVFSQFQRGRYALYMAASRAGKYVRSAPDHCDWSLEPAGDGPCLGERESAPGSAAFDEAQRLERALLARFRQDDYAAAHDGRGWIVFEPPTLPAAADEGLLYQDPPDTAARLAALPAAYRPPAPAPDPPDPLDLLATPDPFLRRRPVPDVPLATPRCRAAS